MDERKRIEELKGKLTEIDLELLRAVERRARLAQELGKLRTGSARYAPVTDGAHLQALEKAVNAPLTSSVVRPLFTAIDAACRIFEAVPRAVYVGAADAAKIGSVRRIAAGALDAGVDRVAVLRDVGHIAERALAGLAGGELVDGEGTGSALDTRRGATRLAAMGCTPIVVLGGDGTCRDVAIGAPCGVMIPISTGTNNVFPAFIDGSSAGTAAGLLARGELDVHAVGRPAKVLHVEVDDGDGSTWHSIALVDLALIEGTGVGARAVVRASAVKLVVAVIASAMSTGLSAIAGRVHPIDRHDPGAVVVHTGPHGRTIGVPIVPGSHQDVGVQSVDVVPDGGSLRFTGPGVLAFDGERERVIGADTVVTVTVRTDGPLVIDVARALHCAVKRRLFDVPTVFDVPAGEAHHGD